jgi:hypothetical protein
LYHVGKQVYFKTLHATLLLVGKLIETVQFRDGR